ncbi:MAG: flagellar protein export ATPase FliI [Alphaproteobacteria bacterium]
MLSAVLSSLPRIAVLRRHGEVVQAQGIGLEVTGLGNAVAVGSRLTLETSARPTVPGASVPGARSDRAPAEDGVPAEVVGFAGDRAVCLAFAPLDGIALGTRAWLDPGPSCVFPSKAWAGRVLDGLGRPIDGRGPLPRGPVAMPVRAGPPPAHARARVGAKLDLGVRALNTFVSCCAGQRLGIFAGSGVGKSVLMSMLARYTACDISVIGLIGERGREVQEFVEDSLGPEGLARSVVIVATSDEPPLMRREAAFLTLAVAEFFRDQGAQVLCMMDSVTRFAMAQREIGLSAGEPPTTKGYTPTVFAELPRLLERAGPGAPGPDGGAGAITGIFTVLVDGDDHNEPVADAVRGILDGHIVMERAIAERGRYPAINVLKSVSRTMPGCNSEAENRLVSAAKGLLSQYDDMAELIRLGAYRSGTDPAVDKAVAVQPALEAFLGQRKDEQTDLASGYDALAGILAEVGEPA